jgi:hypothetical protein
MHHTLIILIVWKNYGLLLSCLKNVRRNGKTESGFNMNGVFKDLYTSMKGKESLFNFLSDEDLKNLYDFFESKNLPAGEPLWKKRPLSII